MIQKESEMYIHVFGEFSITYKGKSISMNDHLSKQSLSLLEVLVLNYDHYVSKNVLMELFWEHNENPESSLKFNIFRLRKLLKSIPEFKQLELIQTDKQGYRFDPMISWEVDAHEVDMIHANLIQCTQYELSDYHKMKKLLYLYKGRLFYHNHAFYFTQQEEYYRSIYLRYITPICEYCLQNERYDDVRQLANTALAIEPSTESIYYYYIMSYVKEGEFTLAKQYYTKATEILSNEYECRLSERMKSLRINLDNNSLQKRNPKEIISAYRNRKFQKGAFYCTNIVFDHIYEQRMRQSYRSNEKFFLYVFEINVGSNETNHECVMKKLETSIRNTLRSGDVFTKLNYLQYLVLLSCPDEEIAFKIACRVSNSYRAKDKNTDNRLHYFVNSITE